MFFEPSGWWKKHLSSVKGSKWGFTFHIFLAKFLSDRFSSVSSDQQHTQRSQAAKKVLASPVLQWNFYQYRSFENSCSLRGWLIMRAFCAVLLCRVVDFNIAFWARWTWIWFGHWSMVSIPHSPVEGICQSLFCLCLLEGWLRGQVWVSCLLRMSSGGSVFDGPCCHPTDARPALV